MKLLTQIGVSTVATVALIVVVRRTNVESGPPMPAVPQAATPDAAVDVIDVQVRRANTSALGTPCIRSANMSLSASLKSGGVALNYREYPPGFDGSGEESSTLWCPTSFVALDVCARQSTELYVVGADDGSCLIERWIHDTPTGAYFIVRPPTIPALGLPCPVVYHSALGIQGGTYIPVVQRPQELRQRRSCVYRGRLDVTISDVQADIEGRYLMIGSLTPRVVYQLPLVPGATPTKLYDEATLPDLANAGRGTLAHHVTLGRVYMMTSVPPGSAGSTHIILTDGDNDGGFEGLLVLTNEEWISQGFEGAAWLWGSFQDHSY